MTECNQSSFGFKGSGKREIVARFDGGTISSDGKRLNLMARLAECFLDGRSQANRSASQGLLCDHAWADCRIGTTRKYCRLGRNRCLLRAPNRASAKEGKSS
jgi:hypothetical protein